MTDLDLAKIKEAVAGARHGPKGCLLLKTEDVAALIARLEAAEANLKWEQHRAGRIGTHSEDCHTWGPQHYECLLRKFNEAEARNATAYAEGVEAAAEKIKGHRMFTFEGTGEGLRESYTTNRVIDQCVASIHSLLKDKPNEKTRQIAPPGQSTGE